MPTVALPFFGEVAGRGRERLADHGYRILVCNSMGRADREREYLDLLVSHRVDGIISGAHNDSLPEYRTVRMPLVTIDRLLSPTIPNITCDNETGGRLATEHLLARGALRPALLTSRSGPHNRREAGYLAVLLDNGVEPVVRTVDFHTPDSERGQAHRGGTGLHARRCGAVFATDDLTAAAVLEWARKRGRRVPEEFKVVGFDATAAMRRALPGLTTIQQPIDDLALCAVDVLLGQIDARAEGVEPHEAESHSPAPPAHPAADRDHDLRRLSGRGHRGDEGGAALIHRGETAAENTGPLYSWDTSAFSPADSSGASGACAAGSTT